MKILRNKSGKGWGAHEFVKAKSTGQGTPGPRSRCGSRMLHTRGRLHKYVRKQFIGNKDKGGFRPSASQRSEAMAVGGHQPTGQKLQFRTPKTEKEYGSKRGAAGSNQDYPILYTFVFYWIHQVHEPCLVYFWTTSVGVFKSSCWNIL